jgi:molybdate transport system permease protein
VTRRTPAPLPWLAGLLAVYLVAPFVAGLAQVGQADWQAADWPSLGWACVVSLLSATLATLLVALGGIPLGYLLARIPGRRMTLLGFVVQLPLALPPLASGILLLFLLGYASPLGELSGGALTDSFAGIVLAEAFVAAPFLIIAARSAFAGLDPVLEDVGATLGHPPLSVFRRVSLPLVWRAILAGMLLAWLRAFGEFGATVMVAYHPYSLPVYTYVAFGSQGLPAMLPVLLPTLLAALGVMAVAAGLGTPRASPAALPILLPASEEPPHAVPPRPAPAQPLRFAFHRVLDGFDLDVAWTTSARRLAILGASGSGKSLTLRLIAGLDRAPGGVLSLGGRDLGALPPHARDIAYVPQAYGLFPHLAVARQVRFAVGCDAARAAHWVDRLGLAGLVNRLPAALSLGQQQRVALARALGRGGALLLLDEPFSALDAPLRIRLRRELAALQAQIDATTILVTHDPEEAMQLADELLILEAGRVLQAGPVDTVFARPASEAVARLLGADSIANGTVLPGGRIDIGAGVALAVSGPPLAPGARVGWTVRPDAIRLDRGGPYTGTVAGIVPSRAGRREAELRIGGVALRVVLGPGDPVGPNPGVNPGASTMRCAVAIHPDAVQVWPLSGRGGPAASYGCLWMGSTQ